MSGGDDRLDELLKARAELEGELRRYKSIVAVMFTDLVGSTSYFDRYGDTAGLAMLGRHAQVVGDAVTLHQGRVIKTIGDSVMAEFSDPLQAVRAGVEMQHRFIELNKTLPERDRMQVRVGINAGAGFRYGGDLFGDVVNVAARLTKHCGPAQILISKRVFDAVSAVGQVRCAPIGAQVFHGKEEKEDVFEVLWTDTGTYTALRSEMTQALAQGQLTCAEQTLDMMVKPAPGPEPSSSPEQPAATPSPASAAQALESRYELLAEIGRGGMGVVYRARDRETGEEVAIKVLKGEIAADPAILERFKNEVRLAHKITHRNVCRTHEFNRLGGTAYIAMELVEGETLRSILQRFGGLPVSKALAVAHEISTGLAEAHRQGVVHRDLKPENVMVDRAGLVKLMDFGIARSVEVHTGITGSMIGTPAYMSPEQAQGVKVDSRTDIYALGLILYELLTGRPAFSGDTPVAVALKQVRETPQRPSVLTPGIPPAVETIITRCLEKDPSRRFQSVEELDRAIQSARENLTTPTPHTQRVPTELLEAAPPAPKTGINKWLAAALVVAVLVAGAPAARDLIRRVRKAQAPLQVATKSIASAQHLSNSQIPPPPQIPASVKNEQAVHVPPGERPVHSAEVPQVSAARKAPPLESSSAAGDEETRGDIFIWLGRFPAERAARNEAERLRNAGMRRIRVHPVVTGGDRTLYEILFGPFKNARAALSAIGRLQESGVSNAYLVRRPGINLEHYTPR